MRKPDALHDVVVEVDERVTIEDYDLNPYPMDKKAELNDCNLIRTPSGDIIRVLRRPDLAEVEKQLLRLKEAGYSSLAISFLHAYIFPDHEEAVADVARRLGFKYVTTSSATSPVMKLLNRSNSTCSEAYLYPIIRDYVENFESGFETPPARVEFMCSDGGLKEASSFRGNEALLSGPAGGVVGIARSCFDGTEGTPIIGFDMVCDNLPDKTELSISHTCRGTGRHQHGCVEIRRQIRPLDRVVNCRENDQPSYVKHCYVRTRSLLTCWRLKK